LVTKTELKELMPAEDYKIASELPVNETGQIVGFMPSFEYEIQSIVEIEKYVAGRKEMDAYRANPYTKPCGFSIESI